ncbi:GNAT family N-acetyltransferase [Actinacidiphila glaucinigra]|uniref:GNAT family N-acetyltransferase n=1 Tax=Actinacidiphila glaucinigra TaxID=235986 RepID=UPI002DDBDCFA|nr:GNAT family N-acetyltransferase [Actinacidiphila glaucinigra]WSD60938.1 GNAT family N-acetyltransferase [Actinacidiphila glaucinigra]
MSSYTIRTSRPDEWRAQRALRLEALKDPAAALAFVNTHDTEAAFGDEVWQQRARTQSFIAEDEAGERVANVSVLVETGEEFDVPQTHLVGVYVRPEFRGGGLAAELLGAAIAWSWELPEQVRRVRLWVHEDNHRAQVFYKRLGFVRTGRTMAFPLDESQTEYEMELGRP